MSKLTLPELQAKDLPCVFCGESSKKVPGGYFYQRFLCQVCGKKLQEINYFLGIEKKIDL